ncbi:MAG TPA: hypothetical protein VKU19_07075 [Bryobacteraceae bacterium]|nr:hypothetical protein [Bryobacteraceae bacterium]
MSACRRSTLHWPLYRKPFHGWFYLLGTALLATPPIPALAQTTAPVPASIDINTAVTTPIASGFSGVSADLGVPIEYWDYHFNALAAPLEFGWVRFPGGTSSDIYNWQTGEDDMDWYAQFPATSGVGTDPTVIALVSGRGGAKLIDAASRANLLGAPLIICVNGYTDTAVSAGQLAAYVKANNIQVAAWELSNEPYLYPTFWATATAYLDAMKPYRDAIKGVLPNAIVAVFVTDQAHAGAATNAWNVAMAAYPNKYWDAITFHHYPAQSTGNFAQWMADESAELVTRSSAVITALNPIGPSGVRFLNTEFDPSIPNDAATGASSITCGTVWGGIYSAEYIMRMSTIPAVLHVGPSEISHNAGVLASNNHSSDVETAAAAGMPINTLSLNFGFYVAAQALGTAVLNGVINHAVQSNQTVVTGGATIPATGMEPIPALYAMSYTNAQGGLSVVLTNKSATSHQVTVRINGAAATGTFPLQFITAADPSTSNTSTSKNTISIQTASSANPIRVPPYSVLRADLTTPPVASFVNSASYQPGPVAPQQLVTAFGSGFASQIITASGQTLPVTLGDTAITITDSKGTASAAPLYYVSPGQASFLIPSGVAQGAASVKVTRGAATVLSGSLTVAAVSPGLYSANGNGAGVAAALAERVSVSGAVTPLSVFSCQSAVPISCLSSALSLGSTPGAVYVSLYGTGIRGAGTVQVYIAGQPAPLQYAGAQGQYEGLDQVNVALPASLAGMGEVSVYVVADGKLSNMTTLNVQ